MTNRRVLISGAGIAGTTLAWWLARSGIEVTVVERAEALRSSGNPVDIRGDALAVVEQMGLADKLRDAATRVRELVFVDDSGRTAGRVDMATFSSGNKDIELPRGDLARILRDAGKDAAEYRFGESITSLVETASGVDVGFASGDTRTFDLVLGADGLHSRVRKLAFGPEAEFVHPTGLYVATTVLPDERADPAKVLLYNTPGRALAIHPTRDRAMAAFIFRHASREPLRPFDDNQHKAILAEAYAGTGWRTTELLQAAMATEDLYFDTISQVRVACWSRGRIALLGDAASCLSLFGEGSSLAIAGAHILAAELTRTPDHAAAFARYEQRHRIAVDPRVRHFKLAAAQMVPATRLGLMARNALVRLVPVITRIGRLLPRREPLKRVHAE